MSFWDISASPVNNRSALLSIDGAEAAALRPGLGTRPRRGARTEEGREEPQGTDTHDL